MSACIFCEIVKGNAPSWKVMENELAYAFLNINPATRYHALIIPKAHYVDIFDIEEKVLQEVISLTKEVADLYKEKWGMTDCQIIQSSGRVGQQHVFHIHFHLVPRYPNDGQDVQWNEHPEWRGEFDQLVKNIK